MSMPYAAAISVSRDGSGMSSPSPAAAYHSPRKGITRWVSGVVITGVTMLDAGPRRGGVPVMPSSLRLSR
jgi:hypothetical protein